MPLGFVDWRPPAEGRCVRAAAVWRAAAVNEVGEKITQRPGHQDGQQGPLLDLRAYGFPALPVVFLRLRKAAPTLLNKAFAALARLLGKLCGTFDHLGGGVGGVLGQSLLVLGLGGVLLVVFASVMGASLSLQNERRLRVVPCGEAMG